MILPGLIYDSLQLAYNLGPDTLICTTDTFVLDAGSNYTTFAWTDGSVNELLSLHSSVADTIAIGVTVTDANGLTGNDSINVIFDICSGVGTNQIEGISIYPVPSTGDVTISSLKENYLLRVVDMTGKIIIQDELVSANHTRKLHSHFVKVQRVVFKKRPFFHSLKKIGGANINCKIFSV